MSDHFDDYPGRGAGDALTPEGRAGEQAAARATDATRQFLALREPPDVAGAVMRRIEALPASPLTPAARRLTLRSLIAALWAPRLISVRPAIALAGAAACAALLWVGMARWPVHGAGDLSASADPSNVFVQFRLEQVQANRVQLAGSFTNWQPSYEMHQAAPGLWTITVPLAAGVHDYSFVVDGEQWVTDPYAPQISDGFGGTNSRVTLLVPERIRL